MYKTVLGKSEIEIIESKSRFIANIKNVKTVEEAEDFIGEIKKKYYDARHNVYAFRIHNEIDKYTDDGEPSKTAGHPILEMLKHENINDVVIVVTRYFGGVLLGTGGLVRAYTLAAKESINSLEIIEYKNYTNFNVIISYDQIGKLQNIIKEENALVDESVFLENVTFNLFIENDKFESIKKKIIDAFNSNIEIENESYVYGYESNNKFFRR